MSGSGSVQVVERLRAALGDDPLLAFLAGRPLRLSVQYGATVRHASSTSMPVSWSCDGVAFEDAFDDRSLPLPVRVAKAGLAFELMGAADRSSFQMAWLACLDELEEDVPLEERVVDGRSELDWIFGPPRWASLRARTAVLLPVVPEDRAGASWTADQIECDLIATLIAVGEGFEARFSAAFPRLLSHCRSSLQRVQSFQPRGGFWRERWSAAEQMLLVLLSQGDVLPALSASDVRIAGLVESAADRLLVRWEDWRAEYGWMISPDAQVPDPDERSW